MTENCPIFVIFGRLSDFTDNILTKPCTDNRVTMCQAPSDGSRPPESPIYAAAMLDGLSCQSVPPAPIDCPAIVEPNSNAVNQAGAYPQVFE